MILKLKYSAIFIRKYYNTPSLLSTGENGNWNQGVLALTFLIIIWFSATQSKVHISFHVKIFTQSTEKFKCKSLNNVCGFFLHNPKAYSCLFYDYNCTNRRFTTSIQIGCRYFWLNPVKSVIIWSWKISYHNWGCGKVDADRNPWLEKIHNA